MPMNPRALGSACKEKKSRPLSDRCHSRPHPRSLHKEHPRHVAGENDRACLYGDTTWNPLTNSRARGESPKATDAFLKRALAREGRFGHNGLLAG